MVKYWSLLCVIGMLLGRSALAGDIKDSESAAHGDEAATISVVEVHAFPGFTIVQFNLAVLSHYSYMLVSDGKAMVVDPDRDINAYMNWAKNEGVTITGVFLSHSNADFVAGHLELAQTTNAKIYQNAQSGAGYKIHGLKGGDTLSFGQAKISFLETPGHTPDGMCALVASASKADEPLCMFSGDTLFVGSIGRPDLMGGTMAASTLASMMFDTWKSKLSRLLDSVIVFPAHGAGSLCGAHLRDEPKTTIGTERLSNPYLQHKSLGAFIAAVLDGLPDAPQYFKHNAAMNRQGPPLVQWDRTPPEAKPAKDLVDVDKYYVVDLRDAQSFAGGHIQNSVNIALRGRLETWVGIMVPWGAKVVLCGSKEETTEAAYRLHRIGYAPVAVTTFESWKAARLPVYVNEKMQPAELYERMQAGTAPVIVDVRLPAEWMGVRIGTVVNMPLNHLAELSSKLDPAQPVLTVCNSAYRSSLGIGILERKGFKQVMSLQGGTQAWIDAGLPVFQAAVQGSGTAAFPIRALNLPDRISADELKRVLMDIPGSFELVDIRPAPYFADYALPGAKNVDIADLLNNPVYRSVGVPLIIVDRDGSLAMMAAGILSQKTKRTIKALYGGLEAYWDATEKKPAVRAVPLPGSAPGVGPGPETPAAPAAPKKKGAGC